jgi:hypothetical protein
MTDWRRIQGRIRKARSSKDAPKELAALYESTRDAMVAFELARLYEKDGSHAEAAQWYTTAAGRFRRAQWKVKAQEALTRLGVEVPLAATEAQSEAESSSEEGPSGGGQPADRLGNGDASASAHAETSGEPDGDAESSEVFTSHASEESLDLDGAVSQMQGDSNVEAQPAGDAQKKVRRRRGRRGGARRRKKAPGASPTAAAVPQKSVEPAEAPAVRSAPGRRTTGGRGEPVRPRPSRTSDSRSGSRTELRADVEGESRRGVPELPSEETEGRVGPAAWHSRKRAGEPALASRLAKLESQLRRMLGGIPHSLEEADHAPAGPGVFIVSDSDLLSDYYVEACQTLRIGIGNLLRSGRTQTGENIRGRLGDHLGITESRVAKYLKDHCAVRWIQLDEGSPMLAHFAIAVMRPALNQ